MLKSNQSVFVGTDVGVFKIPLQHCQDYTTFKACVDGRDLYCKWNGVTGECINSTDDGYVCYPDYTNVWYQGYTNIPIIVDVQAIQTEISSYINHFSTSHLCKGVPGPSLPQQLGTQCHFSTSEFFNISMKCALTVQC